MKMPIVLYSSWLGNNYKAVLNQKEYAICSNRLAQKAGYETVLYTDQKSKSILGDIPYNKVIDFDENVLNQLPKTVWAAAKILAFSLQEEPFMHLDFDFFILKNNFYDKIKNKSFFVFHEEPWNKGFENSVYKHGTKKILETTNNDFNANLTEESVSLNFSIFGTCQNEVVSVIKEQSSFIINLLIKYKQELESFEFTQHFSKHFRAGSCTIPSIVIEQIILPILIMQELKTSYYPILQINNADELMDKFKDSGLVHLWGGKNRGKIDSIIKKHNNS
jgi:hypothetical protein